MKIAIYGSGYVGLVTGACFSEAGHSVLCVDIDEHKIEGLKKGIMPIYEPGLEEMVARNIKTGNLCFTCDAGAGVAHGDLLFIAVGTPPDEDGSADLQYVLDVAKAIGRNINDYKVVINKSTVPVGTAEKVQDVIAAELSDRGKKVDYDVCSNPEFLKEGAAIVDFTHGARIVVGSSSEKATKLLRECYSPYNRKHDKLQVMDVRSAELTKYAANAMLATKISFMNELANLAERLNADIEQVRLGIGSDPRIGYHFIYPGCGYGGSCFPKDVQALARTAQSVGYDPELIRAVENVNGRQKQILFSKLSAALKGDIAGKTIALWGLAFKPNTDDMRDAPSRILMESIWNAGGKVKAFDPEAMKECARIYGDRNDLELCPSREDVVYGSDALVVCTEWEAFRTLDMNWLHEALKLPVVVDGRNIYNPEKMYNAGLSYYSVGRASFKNEDVVGENVR